MNYYNLKIGGLSRKLPIVPLGPKIKIASFSLLGDRLLVEEIAKELARKLKKVDFDLLVGPEVKVVPLLQEVSRLLGKEKYVVLRKRIHGYMVNPLFLREAAGLAINGSDAKLVKGKKTVILDDVVSSGATMATVERLIVLAGGRVEARVAVLRQGRETKTLENIIFLGELPVFRT